MICFSNPVCPEIKNTGFSVSTENSGQRISLFRLDAAKTNMGHAGIGRTSLTGTGTVSHAIRLMAQK